MKNSRDFYNAIIAGGTISEDMIEFANAQLAKMDSTNLKRNEKMAEKRAEKDPIRDAIYAVIEDKEKPHTAAELIERAGYADTVKTASIPSLLRPLVEAGKVEKVTMKVDKRSVRGYVRA